MDAEIGEKHAGAHESAAWKEEYGIRRRDVRPSDQGLLDAEVGEKHARAHESAAWNEDYRMWMVYGIGSWKKARENR